MKKVILSFSILMFLGTIAFIVSCNKNKNLNETNLNNTSTPKMETYTDYSVTIDERGYLVFGSVEDVDNYLTYLSTLTLADIKTWHTTIGFSNLAGNKYDLVAPSPLLTEDEFKDFLLNEDGLVEINSTVFKVTSDDLYLLTIQTSNLNETNFVDFAAGTFNAAEMNRFATRIDRDTVGLDIFDAIAEDPFGINELDPGITGVTPDKFWGRERTCGPCYQIGHNRWMNCITVYYKFWIKTYTDNYSEYMIPCDH